jgi:hypothetical protein
MTTIFDTALRDMFNDVNMAVDALFSRDGGAGINCRVILERDILLQPNAMNSQVYERGTTIEAILSDVGNVPERGDTFTIGAETFTVQAIDRNDGYTVRMIVI